MATNKRRHPNDGDLYTPVTPELLELFQRMRAEHGSWRKVAALSETKLRVLRNLRYGERKAVSQRLLDRMVTSTRVGSLQEFVWFTADDLVALGIWDPVQYVEGYKSAQGGNVHLREKQKARKESKRRKRRG